MYLYLYLLGCSWLYIPYSSSIKLNNNKYNNNKYKYNNNKYNNKNLSFSIPHVGIYT